MKHRAATKPIVISHASQGIDTAAWESLSRRLASRFQRLDHGKQRSSEQLMGAIAAPSETKLLVEPDRASEKESRAERQPLATPLMGETLYLVQK